MKLTKEINIELISDEIEKYLSLALTSDETVKSLAKKVMDKYGLDIEKALDKVNGFLYKLNQQNLIEGYEE